MYLVRLRLWLSLSWLERGAQAPIYKDDSRDGGTIARCAEGVRIPCQGRELSPRESVRVACDFGFCFAAV